jgi:hypothetical protein
MKCKDCEIIIKDMYYSCSHLEHSSNIQKEESLCIHCYQKEKNKGILKCKKKHFLFFRVVLEEYPGGFVCDSCDKEYKNPPSTSWNCKFCQYDLCVFCYKNLISKPLITSPTFVEITTSGKDFAKTKSDFHEEGFSTFKIQNLSQASEKLRNFNIKESNFSTKKCCFNKLTSVEYVLDNRSRFDSYPTEIVSGITGNGFFDAFYLAWALHGNLILSPDDIWLQIMHNVQIYINNNAKTLRSKLVNHEGKIKLDVYVNGWDWEILIQGFTGMIERNTKDNIVSLFKCDFSSTSKVEMLASYTTIMSSCRKYFDYRGHMCICGLKYVSLQGKQEDWVRLQQKIIQMHILFPSLTWLITIKGHIGKFINLFECKNDITFWNNVIVETTKIENIKGPYGIGGTKEVKITEMNGWILDFFPYDSKGKQLSKKNFKYHYIPQSISYCPVTIIDERNGKMYPYLFANAFNGVLETKFNGNVLSYKPITDVCV